MRLSAQWARRVLPELDRLRELPDRGEIVRAAAVEVLHAGRFLSPGMALLVAGVIVATQLLPALVRFLSLPGAWMLAAFWTFVLGSLAAVAALLLRRFRMLLRYEMLTRGVPVCVVCAYDLGAGGACSSRCPECGTRYLDMDAYRGELSPDVATFPELMAFGSPAAARSALVRAKDGAGIVNWARTPLFVLWMAAVTLAAIQIAIAMDISSAEGRGPARMILTGWGATIAVGGAAWYAIVRRRIRAELRKLLRASDGHGRQ